MGYAKYVLSKTGWFPKLEPNTGDVLDAACKVFEINTHKNGYYYIVPSRSNLSYLRVLADLFASNGVILRPHKSKHYGCFVFCVPANGQQFIKDVRRLMKKPNDREEYQKFCEEYAKRKRSVLFPQLVNRIKRR